VSARQTADHGVPPLVGLAGVLAFARRRSRPSFFSPDKSSGRSRHSILSTPNLPRRDGLVKWAGIGSASGATPRSSSATGCHDHHVSTFSRRAVQVSDSRRRTSSRDGWTMSRVRTGTTTRSPLTTSAPYSLRLLRSRQRARVRRIRFIRVPRHTHPGEEVILEGTWEYTVEGKPPVTLKAVASLFIQPERSTRRGTRIGPRSGSSRRISSRKEALITVVQ